MANRLPVAGFVSMLMIAAMAGCAGPRDDPEPSPAPTTTAGRANAPPVQTSAAPAPRPPAGIAYNESATFTPQSAPIFPSFNVTTNWSMLTIEYYLNATAGCYVIGSKPPSGLATGAPPAITITPPVSSAFTFNLPPGPGSCGTESGATIKHEMSEMANERGPWSIAVTGRGQNLNLTVVLRGK
jgi:nitrous oxide reductase accessory protein NosL